MIITTPGGASLPASARLEAFSQVVRLDRDWFDFSQANAGGNNIRFSSDSGKPVDFQLEHWDAEKGYRQFLGARADHPWQRQARGSFALGESPAA